MSKDRYVVRRQKLLSKLRKHRVEAMLVTNFTNVSYLTGFSGDDSFLMISDKLTLLISDSRYTIQLEEECPDLELHIRNNRTPIHKATGDVISRAKMNRVAIESSSVTLALWEKLKDEARGAEFVCTESLVEELRQIKDRHEIAEIREAISQAERGFAVMKASLTDDMTELQAAHQLEAAMRRFGAQGAAFESIVAVGPRAALPHARPSHVRIGESDFVLVDWGATNLTGYKSDLTRVLVTGKILTKLEKVYRVVLSAQSAGIRSIRPGVRCQDVDTSARSVIEKAGFGKQFGHGLGHGFGLEIHEWPRISPVSETVLKPGMVVTVEPGIYLPGWGGVRIEDDVLVTRNGHEVLTSVPKEFEDAILV